MLSDGFINPMKDKGIVISTKAGFARVEVGCLNACKSCAARALCLKNDLDTGLLSVRNTLQAHPGDEVTIDVPDTMYSKTLIHLFAVLLGGCLSGLALGYLASRWISLGASESSLIGLCSGVLAAGFLLTFYFKKRNNSDLYPVITGITRKGEHHE